MTNRLVLKDHEQRLMHISREIYEVAMTIAYIGDNMAAGELMKLERSVRAFAINPALRARQDGERTKEELLQFNQFMLYISEIHQDFAEVILKEMEAAVEEKK